MADRVIILANSADQESVRLARYYAAKRAVPAANIIALPMSAVETIEWPEFVATIWQPLQDELVRLNWINVVTMGTIDDTGRKRRAPHGHRISYLVICRGVPLKISHSAEFYRVQLPATAREEFRTNQGAVDSELALLALGTPPINGFIDNPLFNRDHPTALDEEQVVKVSRLDGPSYDSARALVDNALAGERDGLLGRAYVDIGGVHPDGDRWLEAVALELQAMDFPMDVDRLPTMIPQTARFDAPVLYFGWYAATLGGPFGLSGFHFPPGAVAFPIHSTSASTLRSSSEGWSGPLVARGVTATVGNVFEPYLQLTHRPSLLLHGLALGMTFGDAAAYALPVLSWQSIAIGDPLYRPFAVPLAAQLAKLDQLDPRLRAYASLHEALRLDGLGQPARADAVLRAAAESGPSLAVGLEIADRALRSGDNAAALRAIAFASQLRDLPADQWGLARLVAMRFTDLREPLRAMAVYRNLFAIGELPRELRLAWLPEALAAAKAAGDSAQSVVWGMEFSELTKP